MVYLNVFLLLLVLLLSAVDIAKSEPSLMRSGKGDSDEAQWPTGLKLSNGLKLSTWHHFIRKLGTVLSNGLNMTNGMNMTNGLRTVNKLRTTKNGLPPLNGLTPDGLLSSDNGLMSSEEGVDFASYLIRCALPSTSTIEILKWDETLVTMHGEVGLAPEWEEDLCAPACQEKVSACLLALTNGSGEHVTIEMTAPWHSMGTNHEWIVSEAVFYGNLFRDPPEAYMAAGMDYAQTLRQASENPTVATDNLVPRSCNALMAKTMIFDEFSASLDDCPVMLTGSASSIGWEGLPVTDHNKCELTNVSPDSAQEGTAVKCSISGSNSMDWHYPITTWISEGHYSASSIEASHGFLYKSRLSLLVALIAAALTT